MYRLGERQLGVVLARQLAKLEAPRWFVDDRVRTGILVPVFRGAYRLAGAPASFEGRVLAACMLLGGRASHATAAAVLRFQGWSGGPIEVTVPRDKHRVLEGAVVHRADLGPADRCSVGSLKSTSPGRTIVDLAGRLRLTDLEDLVDAELTSGRLSERALRNRVAAAGRTKRGAGALREMLSGPVPHSVLERMALRTLAGAAPRPELQHEIFDGRRFVARVDMFWPDQRLVLELNGRRFHGAREVFEADIRREADLNRLGFTVRRVTYRMLRDDPAFVVAYIQGSLAAVA